MSFGNMELEAKLQVVMGKNQTTEFKPLPMEWLVSFKDPGRLWAENWFALVLEIASIVAVFIAYRHAKSRGSESQLLILTGLFTALCFELLPFIPRPGYLLWWYHQGAINFLKLRAPAYVICVFTVVHYLAHCATSRTNLPLMTRSLVTSLCAMTLYFPCLWLAPRLLLMLLHFDDPLFAGKLFGVPHIQLITLTMMFFHTSHVLHQNYQDLDEQSRNPLSLLWCAFVSGFAAAAYSIVEQYLLYISLHLTMKAGTAVCLVACILVLVYLAKDEITQFQYKGYTKTGIFDPLKRKEFWALVAAFACISAIPLLVRPENLRSNGERMELGPCGVTHEVSNTSPLYVERSRYVCPNDTAVLGFNFHCVPRLELLYSMNRVSDRYTICGSPFENPDQLAKQLAMYSLVCLLVIHTVMSLTFDFGVTSKKKLDSLKKLE